MKMKTAIRRGPDLEQYYKAGGPLVAWFYDEVYEANYYLFRCAYTDFKRDALKRWPGIVLADYVPGGKVVEYENEKGRQFYLLWLPTAYIPKTLAKEIEAIAVLAHEVLHLTIFVLMKRGLKPTLDEHEAFTYYNSWLFAECLKHFTRRK